MKNRVPIIAAIVLGVIVVIAIQSYVKRAQEQAKAQLKGRQVVAARVDIPQGAEITESMLGLVEVPDRFIPQQAITSSGGGRHIIGRATRWRIAPGNLQLWSDVDEEKRGGLSSLIPEGERAYTLNIQAGVGSDRL